MTSIPEGEGEEVAEGGVGEAVWEAASRVAAAVGRLDCICELFVESKKGQTIVGYRYRYRGVRLRAPELKDMILTSKHHCCQIPC